MSEDHYRKKTLAILVGGGPAPGINRGYSFSNN